jgi:hypothetical protein
MFIHVTICVRRQDVTSLMKTKPATGTLDGRAAYFSLGDFFTNKN